MFRIDDPTAAAALPAPEAAGAEGYFTEGNPGVTQATLVRASWLNMIQEELTAIVTAAGLVRSKTTYNQVLQAIKALQQTGTAKYAVDTGVANTYQVAYSPAITAINDGMVLHFKAKTANTGASTFNPNGLGASPIWNFNHVALQGGEIVANSDVWVQWNSSLNGGSGAWLLIDATGGNQISGRLLNVQVFSANGTYTPTPGTTSVVVEVQGGGGGGSGSSATGAGQLSSGSGGNGGTYARSRITSGFSGAAVTVGGGGAGGTAGSNGSQGGTSSFGALVSAPGGLGGLISALLTPPFVSAQPSNTTSATGGNIVNQPGFPGGFAVMASTQSAISGTGGASVFGGGPQGVAAGSGAAAVAKGAGGSAGLSAQSSAANTGGAGAAGIVIVWEYA